MRIIEPTDDLDACLALRHAVFVAEQGVPPEVERDALDDRAAHFLAWDGDRPVGTARVVITGDTGKIGRVCVLADQRGSGLGMDLIDACLAYLAAQADVTRAVLGAQTHALGFYEKLGFAAFGPEFQDGGLPHRMMEKPV